MDFTSSRLSAVIQSLCIAGPLRKIPSLPAMKASTSEMLMKSRGSSSELALMALMSKKSSHNVSHPSESKKKKKKR